MRISDWSSDVCSSDLPPLSAVLRAARRHRPECGSVVAFTVIGAGGYIALGQKRQPAPPRREGPAADSFHHFGAMRIAPSRRMTSPFSIGLRTMLRSEEHTSELQSLMRISYAGFCLKKQNKA